MPRAAGLEDLGMRSWYGALAALTTAGALLAVIWLAGTTLRAAFAYRVAWFLLLGGVRSVMELARTPNRAVRWPPNRRLPGGRLAGGGCGTETSDAGQLAWLTGVPGEARVVLFALVAAGALVIGARLLVPWPAHLPPLRVLSGK